MLALLFLLYCCYIFTGHSSISDKTRVQQEPDSTKPEAVREIPPEQQSQAEERAARKETVGTNRQGILTGASNIQAQSNGSSASELHINPDQGMVILW